MSTQEVGRLRVENEVLRGRLRDLMALVGEQNDLILTHQRLNGSPLNVSYEVLEYHKRTHRGGVVVERAVLRTDDGTEFVIEDRGIGPHEKGRRGELRTWRHSPAPHSQRRAALADGDGVA